LEVFLMGTRGRKSAAELSVIHGVPQRPDPPEELTTEQAEEWREIVASLPADWFKRETWPLLLQYCRHIVNARRIARLIEAAQDMDMGDRTALMRLNRLLSTQERQTGALVSLGTRMRLTNQSRYTPLKAASRTRGSGGKPIWEV
jgi:hypothetical protein